MTGAVWAPVLAAGGSEEAADALLELGLVLLALGAVARMASRAGISPIPFYLLGGLAFGQGGVWQLGASDAFIEVGAAIGVALLLLMMGLEYSADELTSNLRQGLRPSLLDLVLNAAPGVVCGVLLGWEPIAWLALGAVTYISSSGVIAKVIADLDRTANRETPVVLSLLVSEDLVMAVFLPVLAGLLVGGSLVATGVSVAVALAAVGVTMLVAVRYGEHISRIVFSRSDEVLLFTILGMTFAVAGLAEDLKVSAAVGAFLVGIAISGRAAHQAVGIITPLRDLFAAVFFLFFGFGIDTSDVVGALPLALVLAVVTGATKVVTGWWAAARAGVARRGRFRAGTVLIARGEFSIVIAGLVVASGEQPELGPFAAAYVLVLAVSGPIITRFSDQLVDRFERRAASTG